MVILKKASMILFSIARGMGFLQLSGKFIQIILHYCRDLKRWQCHQSPLENYCSCGFYFLLKVLRLLRGGTQQNPNPIRKNGGSMSREVITSLCFHWHGYICSTYLVHPLHIHVPRTRQTFTNGVQQSSAKMVRGLEPMAYKRRLRELAWRRKGKKKNLTASLPLPKGRR